MNKHDRERRRRQDVLEKQRKQVPRAQARYLNPSVAQREKILFSFLNLDTNRNIFKCSAGHGSKLLNVFDDLRKHSGYDRIEIGQRKNFHPVPEADIKKCGLVDLATLAGNSKLFQLGSQAQPERIIGFFESFRSHVFQVCLFDLEHKLSPSN